MSVGELITEISRLSHAIQDIDNQIIRLTIKRDELINKRDDLREKRKKLESKGDVRNAEVGMQLTMDMLSREVGFDGLFK